MAVINVVVLSLETSVSKTVFYGPVKVPKRKVGFPKILWNIFRIS